MKLSEIMTVSQHTSKRFSISDIDTKTEEYVGDSEGSLHIWSYKKLGSKSIIYMLADEKKKPLTYLTGEFVNFRNNEYLIVQDIFTPKDLGGKGYATAVYYSLVTKYHIKIISDSEQSPLGRKLWDALRKRIKAKIYDTKTGTMNDDDGTVPENDLYSPYSDIAPRYRLILERVNDLNEFRIPKVGRGILSNYLMFTADEDHGKYL